MIEDYDLGNNSLTCYMEIYHISLGNHIWNWFGECRLFDGLYRIV